MKRLIVADVLASLSLSNLCFIKLWNEILSPSGPIDFRIPLAAVLNILALAAVFLTLIALARAHSNPRLHTFVKAGFLIAVFCIADELRGIIAQTASWDPILNAGAARIIAVSVVVLGIVRLYGRYLFPLARTMVLLLSPLVLFSFVEAGNTIVNGLFRPSKTVPPQWTQSRTSTRKRIVLCIFDELDEQLAFEQRPASLRLPELDRLREESFTAPAIAPSGITRISIPAYLTGRAISRADITGSDLTVHYAEDNDAFKLSSSNNIFSQAKAAGLQTAALGWYLPYCQIFAGSLDRCWSVLPWNRVEIGKGSFLQTIAREVWLITPGSDRYARVDAYRQMLLQAKSAVTDPNLDLVFLHWPVPHMPPIYDRRKQQLTVLKTAADDGYLDNLALVDSTLVQLRNVMTTSGLWDRTNFIVTSDHWWRGRPQPHAETYPIPFLLKLAGEHQRLAYSRRFDAILLRELVEYLFTAAAPTAKDIGAWIDAEQKVSS